MDDKKSKQFQELIENHKGILFKVARTYCQNDDDRQDLIQEIRIQIWQSLDKYNSDYKISTWLYRVSINTAISFYRKDKNRQQTSIKLDDKLQQPNELYDIEKEDKLNLLEQFIYELNEFDKAIMLLYLEEKSHEEISNVLGASKSNIGTKIGRIKEKLKNRFSEINQLKN
jgi:RNA polymerase sigma-70 factor (ECF subfamily)